MTFPILLLAFIFVPVIEIALLIRIGGAIGAGTTILIVIFTAILGAYLVRQQGFATLNAVQSELNAGRVPAMQMAEGLALLIAGAVLLTPGFVTDAFGFALLTPPLRQAFIKWIISRGVITASSANSYQPPHDVSPHDVNPAQQGPATIIEGEYSERD
ncbi:MAG: FxsA family protein [Pseudomonadota bacterium]